MIAAVRRCQDRHPDSSRYADGSTIRRTARLGGSLFCRRAGVIYGAAQVRGVSARPAMCRAAPNGPDSHEDAGARQVMDVVLISVGSRDGTKVPLTVLPPAGSAGPVPTVLFAYGAYGVPIDPRYSPFRASLLARNVSFAVAHIRGGGDQGPRWHEAARTPPGPAGWASARLRRGRADLRPVGRRPGRSPSPPSPPRRASASGSPPGWWSCSSGIALTRRKPGLLTPAPAETPAALAAPRS
jgi:hypothetical protein